jgi:predicted MFS family arabinose efflux permease
VSTGYRPNAGIVVAIALGLVLSIFLCLDPKLKNLGISLAAMIGVVALLIVLVMVPTSNATISKAQFQFVEIFRSRTLWMAVGMLFLVYTVPGLNTALTYRQNDVLKMSTKFIGMLDAISYGVGAIAAGAYFFLCRKFNLRVLLVASLVMNGLMTLLYLSAVYTKPSAPLIHALLGVTFLSELSLMDLAVRSTPKGCEALGFALMMSIRNFGIAVSDIIGTKMIDQYKWEFNNLVLLNASTTLLCLAFLPLLPKLVMSRKEGESTA